ncbi:MAG: hypothetical protein HKN51_04380 [Saprospiraceae bacterium]|nr:hypothetical protein [Saprospiraceae bacterium]
MFKRIKHKLRQVMGRTDRSGQVSIRFPGGIRPISETLAEDIFIVGFPKSGNTLMQHIIAHLVYGINEESSRTMVNLIVPDIYANSHYFRMNDVCYFKSHELPQPQYKKVIYIMRDGREALLSFYHMRKNMGHDISLEELYSGKLKIFNTTWQEHIQQWESNPFEAEILWLKFEDLKLKKEKELKKICKFLNIERSDDEIKKVVDLTSFHHMKKLEARKDWVKMKNSASFKSGFFMRKGKVNSYLDEVSKEIIKEFERSNNQVLKRYYNEL